MLIAGQDLEGEISRISSNKMLELTWAQNLGLIVIGSIQSREICCGIVSDYPKETAVLMG
jgi:hypothetical protein